MDTSNNSNFTTHIEDEKESFITDDKTKSRKCTVKKEYRAPISIGFSLVMIVVLATSCSASPPYHSGSCSVEAVRGSVVTKVSSKNSHDIINAQVNGAYVASCTLHPPSAEISEAEYKELYAIATTPNKECVFTIYSFNGTSIAINITSATSSLAEGIIEGLASSCIYPSALVFKLIGEYYLKFLTFNMPDIVNHINRDHN
ncbi:hypothetical protein MAR_002746 [Mya arenaria]|uniref:Uncharacterized protein n=1 Tax=Mya arenaria TaxID=6604 RepID=A0ABY7G401_MYAAR|nr:hypothetical protein MAR_002746 [Mya arenaria]